MRQKMMMRYWCDHCNKPGGSSHAMKKHELICTKNPERHCGMCSLMENVQKPMSELVAIMQEPAKLLTDTLCHGYDNAMREAMVKLRQETSNCPACILAALRQSGTYSATSDFKSEAKSIREDIYAMINQERREIAGY